MGGAQFQTRQNSTSQMSPLGCDVIVSKPPKEAAADSAATLPSILP